MSKPVQRRRVFRRDSYIGFRCPTEYKLRLEELARKRVRDLSSLALEFIGSGLAKAEQEQQKTASLA